MTSKKSLLKQLPFYALIFAVVGFILRFFQRKNELLADGSIADGSVLYKILPLVCLCVAIGAAIILWRMPRYTAWEQLYQNKLLSVILGCAAGVLLLGNIFLLLGEQEPASLYISSAPEFSEFLNNLLPPLGILSALCIAFYAYQCYRGKKPSPLLYMCASLYLAVRLIVCFQAWNTDPSIHDYCYALLAGICTMLGTFHIAGFSFDKGKCRMSLFWLICAFVFNGISIADAVYDDDLGALLIYFSLFAITAVNALQLVFAKNPTLADTEASPTDDGSNE